MVDGQRNWNRKTSTKGKVATERAQMGRDKREKKKGRATGGIITGVKLGIKEKRQEKDACNKWWKIMTIYSKEMKTTRRRVEDTMKENRENCIFLEEDFNGRIGEREAKRSK
jgi:hypothetical protein